MKYLVTEACPLIQALTALSPQSTKNTLRSWLKDGRVSVDGEMVKIANLACRKGQQIEVSDRKKIIQGNIQIIFEDQHIVVIDKPYGILSVAAAFNNKETAHAFLKEKYRPRRVHVVHRLDQETSGVMLFALSEYAYDGLKETFAKHDLERQYVAIVEGQLEQSSGTWQSYQYEDPNYVVHETTDPEGARLCITHYKVEETARHFSRLRLTLETGRKNQIRVHCQSAGHPVVGDKKYGGTSNPIKRLCLHANLLALKHPVTGKEMRFESPVPPGFEKLVQ